VACESQGVPRGLLRVLRGLLVWSLLTAANRPVLVADIPALVLYLFAIWAAIVLVLFLARPRSGGEDSHRAK
jgi:hypothetical protein